MNQNPFDLTKATDLSDQSIYQLWVNCASKEHKSLALRIDPRSIMPKFVLGGKGCGKTHALRYFSYDVKRCEHGESNIKSAIIDEKYIGVLVKSEEINVHRFSEKNIADYKWKEIFAYYFELWVARQSIKIIADLCAASDVDAEKSLCNNISNLFMSSTQVDFSNFKELISFLSYELKSIDYNVNNCIFNSGQSLESINIKTSPGSLLFGVPSLFSEIYSEFQNVLFIYMIDQYEDFSLSKQKHINTLIRYKKNNATFWIGSRYYGIKTYETDSSGEVNKEDAEFVTVNLDDFYRSDAEHYKRFAEQVIINRLTNNGSKLNGINLFEENDYFYLKSRNSSPLEYKNPFQTAKKESCGRKHITKFRSNLIHHKLDNSTIDQIVKNVSSKDYPLLEKAAIFSIYKKWNSPEKILKLSENLKDEIDLSILQQKPTGNIEKVLNHFKSDLMAQLYHEAQSPIYNYGLNELISLSWGNPRHLLTLLKKVFSWGIFNGEVSDESAIISIRSQVAGISEASEWLYEEPEKSVAAEPSGKQVTKAITRLCNFFRELRYSSKPSESSLCTFAVNSAEISDEARKIMDSAQQLLQIVSIGMHIGKNSGAKISKYQINRLLAPKWGLPLSSRGTITLSKKEVDAIFVENDDCYVSEIIKTRLKRMEPPFKLVSKNILTDLHNDTSEQLDIDIKKTSGNNKSLNLFDGFK